MASVATFPMVGSLGNHEGIDAIYVGIAPPGGKLPPTWRPILEQALKHGIDVVSGLHDFVSEDRELSKIAVQSGAQIVDVRKNMLKETATCEPFRKGNLRIHAVGHDCSVGKMVVTVELERRLKALGHDAKFLATGQTGIMISGEGVPVDCVVSDFVNGAVEQLVRSNEQHDILLIEGQGSISHPAFSAVTLGLLHGCAPQGLVFCYEAGRTMVKGLKDIPIPPLAAQMDACVQMANLRHPSQMIAVAINTRTLNAQEARAEVEKAEREFGLPACDVYRDGCDKLVQAVLKLRKELEQS